MRSIRLFLLAPALLTPISAFAANVAEARSDRTDSNGVIMDVSIVTTSNHWMSVIATRYDWRQRNPVVEDITCTGSYGSAFSYPHPGHVDVDFMECDDWGACWSPVSLNCTNNVTNAPTHGITVAGWIDQDGGWFGSWAEVRNGSFVYVSNDAWWADIY